jgi:hypothetical protein
MAQNNTEEKSLLETISNIGSLESELLEDAEVKSETEEVVEETQPETVEEGSTFKVWGEDEDQDAEDSDEESEEEEVSEEEDDGIDGTKKPDEGPSDAEEVSEEEHDDEEEDKEEAYMDSDSHDDDEEGGDDEVDTGDVEVSADDAEDDMEDEVEDEVTDGDDDGEDADEDEVEEAEVVDGDSGEEDGIDGAAEPDQDVDQAIDQISKTITAAATHKAMKKIEASYGSMKEDLDALCAEDDSLTEEFKTKAATIFEAAVSSKVREHIQSIEESYTDYISEEVNTLHEGLIDKIDSYLTYVAEQWIEKNEVAVTNTLRADIAEGFMTSLKSTFTEHYIEMPEGKTDMFDEVAQSNAELTEKVESKDEEIKALAEEVISLKKTTIVSELSEGLVDTQASKFKELTKDIVFESAEEFTKKAKIVRESYFSNKKVVQEEEIKTTNSNTKTQVVIEEVKEESDGLSPLMTRYINASSKLEKEAF